MPEREAVPEPASGPGKERASTAQALQDIGGTQHPGSSAMREPSGDRGPGQDPARTSGRETTAEVSAASPAAEAVAWAMAHLSEREAVFSRADLFAAALAHAPGTIAIEEAEREVAALEKAGTLHPVDMPGAEDSFATAKTVAEERETVASMRAGQSRGAVPMRGWQVQGYLSKGPLTAGQKDAVKLILAAEDRVIGVQGYAGSGKTTMLDRARVLAAKKGYRMIGLAPSASAVQTLAAEAGIESETLQMFLARNAGVAEGRLTTKGAKEMRGAFAKTILVVDEGSLASTVQARDLLRIANELRIPRVVLVGDAKQLDAVDAGKPFAPAPGRRDEDRGDGRDHAPARPGPEGGRGGEPQGRHRTRLREAREQCRRGQIRQYRGRRRGALAEARTGSAGEHRRHGAEPRAPPGDQRTHPRAPRPRRPHPRPCHAERTPGLEGLHQCREGARRQLCGGRRGGLSPPLQADRRREGRRAPRHGCRSQEPRSAA